MFHLVEFEDKGFLEVAVVPDNWLLEGQQCYWPEGGNSKWVKQVKPPQSSWPVFKYRRILDSNDSYEYLKRKEEKAKYDSDLASDSVAEYSRHGRRLKSSKVWSPSCAENRRSRSPRSPSPQSRSLRSPSPRTRSRSPRGQSRSESIERGTPSPRPPRLGQELPPFPQRNSNSLPSSTSGEIREMFGKVFKILDTLTREVKDTKLLVEKLVSAHDVAGATKVPSMPEGFTFPIEDPEELERLNSTLQHDQAAKDSMIKLLGAVGGSEVRDIVARVMSRIMSTALTKLYNITGKKGKRSLSDLGSLSTVIVESIRMNAKGTTEKEIESKLGRWISGAGDRDGGRKEREERKRQTMDQ